jgi:hypothetical protein
VTRHGRLADRPAERDGTAKATQAEPPWVARVRSVERLLDGAILVILGALLLPLVVGPFVAAYQFASDGQYAGALFIVSLFGCLALVAIRAVRRGEFGPGVFFLGVGLIAGVALLAAALSR